MLVNIQHRLFKTKQHVNIFSVRSSTDVVVTSVSSVMDERSIAAADRLCQFNDHQLSRDHPLSSRCRQVKNDSKLNINDSLMFKIVTLSAKIETTIIIMQIFIRHNGQHKTVNHKNNNQSKQTGKQTQIKIQSK